jgi:hypothetical protein
VSQPKIARKNDGFGGEIVEAPAEVMEYPQRQVHHFWVLALKAGLYPAAKTSRTAVVPLDRKGQAFAREELRRRDRAAARIASAQVVEDAGRGSTRAGLTCARRPTKMTRQSHSTFRAEQQ